MFAAPLTVLTDNEPPWSSPARRVVAHELRIPVSVNA
jgi:hypothetical protein